MDKHHMINLHRLAAQARDEFQSAIRNRIPDAELGKYARVWAEAEISLAKYREDQLARQLRISDEDTFRD